MVDPPAAEAMPSTEAIGQQLNQNCTAAVEKENAVKETTTSMVLSLRSIKRDNTCEIINIHS